MNRARLAMFIVLVGLIAAGCSSSSSDRAGSKAPKAVGMLRMANGAAELEASIKGGFTAISDVRELTSGRLDVTANAGSGSGSGSGFTGTYTQEVSVDEFDAVRYDGSHLYIAPQRDIRCCFILADAQPAGAQPAGTEPPTPSIRILATDPADSSATPVSEIPLADNVSVQGMYLGNDTMFALTSEAYYGSYGGFFANIAIWAPEKMGFQVYDTSDASSPALKFEASFDGVFVESRRVGDTVYIVSRYTPTIDGVGYDVTTLEQQAENLAGLEGVTLEELLPKVVVNGVTRTLVDPNNCYISSDPNDRGYPVIMSVTAVPIDNPDAFRTTCYNADNYGVYVSATALYLTEFRFDFDATRSLTRIHKFGLNGTGLTYKGSAEIAGQVWRGGQADFRMSEHNGDLRALASEWDWPSEDIVDHTLYVLRESPTRPELEVLSQLPNAARPEEIGKPNEALYGVRFFGERAYAVTFRQIDPLYVIDLSNPADPRLAGTLEVTGFSDFLHPVNDNLLLGLGAAASGGVKLELFDVSDPVRPLSRGSSILGGRGSSSEARYDRHAFTYQADAGNVDRFAIPADLYSEDGTYSFVESGLYLYEIRDKDTSNLATLNAVGAIVTDRAGTGTPTWYAGRNRAFIHDDTVYYVRDEDVWAALWSSPFVVNGPF